MPHLIFPRGGTTPAFNKKLPTLPPLIFLNWNSPGYITVWKHFYYFTALVFHKSVFLPIHLLSIFFYFPDVIGVVKSVGDMTTVIGKQSNREIKKRDISLVDDDRVQVRLTIWGNDVSYLPFNLKFVFEVV